MLEAYLVILAVWVGISLFCLVVAAAAHMDYRDADSASNVRAFIYLTPLGLVWPLVGLAALGWVVYAVGKSVSEVFSKEYR